MKYRAIENCLNQDIRYHPNYLHVPKPFAFKEITCVQSQTQIGIQPFILLNRSPHQPESNRIIPTPKPPTPLS
jgi:hypothetical protein